jgi:ELWxxDGT repeat protein
MIDFKGKALFEGKDGTGKESLWVTDGTSAGTQEFFTFSATGTFNPFGLTFFNGQVFFSGKNSANSFGLWKTDGTAAGTQEVAGISGTIHLCL